MWQRGLRRPPPRVLILGVVGEERPGRCTRMSPTAAPPMPDRSSTAGLSIEPAAITACGARTTNLATTPSGPV